MHQQNLSRAANLFGEVASKLDIAYESHFHWNDSCEESHVYFPLHPQSQEAVGFKGFEMDVSVNKDSLTLLALLVFKEFESDYKFSSRIALADRLDRHGYKNWYRDKWCSLDDKICREIGNKKYTPLHERGTPVDIPAHVEIARYPLKSFEEIPEEKIAEEIASKIHKFVFILRTAKVFPSISLLREKWEHVKSLDFCTTQKSNEKGKAFEDFSEILFHFIPQFDVEKRVRPITTEFDLVISNRSQNPFWYQFGFHIYVECKNETDPVGPDIIREFAAKICERKAKCGLILTRKGVTEAAKIAIKTYKSHGKTIIYLDDDDIELICQNLNITGILEQRILET